jgi:hypothetical protein
MTIAVENIPREHMRGIGFDKELMKNHPEIEIIYEHRNTDKIREQNVQAPAAIPIGRWNIMVKREKFNNLALRLRDSLKSEYDEFLDKTNVTNYGFNFSPEVTSKLRVQEALSDDGSLTTRDSWITYFESCSISTFEMSQETRNDLNIGVSEPSIFNVEIPEKKKSYAQATRTTDSPSDLTTPTGKDIEFKELTDQVHKLTVLYEEQMKVNKAQLEFINYIRTCYPPQNKNNVNDLPLHPMSPPRYPRTKDLTARSLEQQFEENNNRSLKRQCDKETPEKLKRGGNSSP